MRTGALGSSTIKALGLSEDTLDPGTNSGSASAAEVAGTVTSFLARGDPRHHSAGPTHSPGSDFCAG